MVFWDLGKLFNDWYSFHFVKNFSASFVDHGTASCRLFKHVFVFERFGVVHQDK